MTWQMVNLDKKVWEKVIKLPLKGQPSKLYLILLSMRDTDQKATITQADLGEIMGLSVRTIQRLLKTLEGCSLVKKVDKAGYTNTYIILDPECFQVVDQPSSTATEGGR